jgi:dihydrofolate reductase
MASIGAFISLSLDGCYADANGDMSWAHSQDPEQAEFTAQNARGGSGLLFGRVTYEMMSSFWPSEQAAQMMPDVAAGMNAMPKFVASRSMKRADWANTTVIGGDLVGATRRMKSEDGPDLTILGSGSIVTQLATAGLLDSLDVMLVPVALGGGKRLFEGMPRSLGWRREDVRQFSNGNVFLRYRLG